MREKDKDKHGPSRLPDPEDFVRGILAQSYRKRIALFLRELALVLAAGIGGAVLVIVLKKWFRIDETVIVAICAMVAVLLLLPVGYFSYR